MLPHLRLMLALLMLSVAASGSPQPAVTPPRYTVTDLGTLGGADSQAYSINARGQVVGQAQTPAGDWHAFLWSHGKMRDLGTLGGTRSTGEVIDDSGAVYGTSETGHGGWRRFRWQSGRMVDSGSGLVTINVRTRQGMPPLGKLTKTMMNLIPTGVNRKGYATAVTSFIMIDGYYHPVPHGYLWTGQSLTDLGRLGGQDVEPNAINDSDWIVGFSSVVLVKHHFVNGSDEEEDHAFLWIQGHMTDLNSLLPPSSGWLLEWAYGINDRGQIVGGGMHNGKSRAFLLSPA